MVILVLTDDSTFKNINSGIISHNEELTEIKL